jgi:hypothetical protein
MKIEKILAQLPDFEPDKKFQANMYKKIIGEEISNGKGQINGVFRLSFLKNLALSLSLNLISLVVLYMLQSSYMSPANNFKEAYIDINAASKNEEKFSLQINDIYSTKELIFDAKKNNDELIMIKLTPGFYYAQVTTKDGAYHATPVWVTSLN